MKLVRGFLYLIAIAVFLVVAIFFALRLWPDQLSELVFVPDTEFVEQEPLQVNAYQDPSMWFSRPGLGVTDPARWQPAYTEPEETASGSSVVTPAAAASTPSPSPVSVPEETPRFAVFFIHPTSYFAKAHWNAPLDDETANERAILFIKGMASPFNKASEIWAPRYRQAAIGAFLTDAPDADQALDAAYRDVELAFDFFLDSIDPDMPIVLAGHSQGSVHMLRLLRSRIAGTPLQNRIAMAYPIGWPISIEHDVPSLGLPACATPQQAGCIVSWVSFAEPADPGQMLKRYRGSPGFDGQPRADSAILCSNPLSGTMGGSAGASKNLGTLVPDDALTTGELVPAAVPARCSDNGLLLIGDPPELGPGVLPENNYHVYDIPLFWANLQQDVVRRVKAWEAPR